MQGRAFPVHQLLLWGMVESTLAFFMRLIGKVRNEGG